jgi:hypothetical protein
LARDSRRKFQSGGIPPDSGYQRYHPVNQGVGASVERYAASGMTEEFLPFRLRRSGQRFRCRGLLLNREMAMQGTGCLYYVPMTPEDVLAQIRNAYQLAVVVGEADPDRNWTFDSKVKEWWLNYIADHWGSWKNNLVQTLNRWFSISSKRGEWAAVLASGATLRELCQLVSDKGALRPAARPCRILGNECTTAGVFFAIQALLVEAGVPARRVWPSTPIADVVQDRHQGKFLSELAKLAGDTLPPATFRQRPLGFLRVGFLVLRRLLPVAFWAGELTAWLLILTVGGVLLTVLVLRPRFIDFGEVRTFADLSRCIVRSERFAPGS